ncbi:hypothetical protein QFZ39_001139 [Paraburkholderia graminis]|nr:hypothetical protein [Paraburkholderia graminis]
MTDAVQALGQHVQEEAPHELVGRKRHRLVACAAAGPIVLPAEGHAALVERDESLVGDGYAMCIARQIRKHSIWSCERPLRIHHPFACAQRREPPRERSGIGKCGVITEEPQLVLAICVGELFQETPPEQPREHAYWQEEAGPACDPPLAITREASTGNDAVHVRMVAVAASCILAPVLACGPNAAQAQSLKTYDVKLDETTVCGISSGAYMAVQFAVAYSSIVKGVGATAGGPYFCAGTFLNRDLTIRRVVAHCMQGDPSYPVIPITSADAASFIRHVQTLSIRDDIDPRRESRASENLDLPRL